MPLKRGLFLIVKYNLDRRDIILIICVLTASSYKKDSLRW